MNNINWKNVLTVTKKEISSFLNNPASYIVLIVFLALWEFVFFKNAFLIGESSLRSLYDLFPWLMLILVPAVTMGSISKENDDGTLEILLTHPLREVEFLLGKFFGCLSFVTTALLFPAILALSFSRYGFFDWGVFAGQLLGSFLFSAAFIALGIFISGLVKDQIASLLLTAGSGFIFTVIGSEFFTMGLPLEIGPILERLSLTSHLQSIARGVIEFRDVWYYVSFLLVFLSLAFLQLLSRRYGNNKLKYSKLHFNVLLFVGIAVLTNVIGNRLPGRIDLTKDKLYTTSSSTKKILKNLDDIVNVTFYVSAKLPAQYSSVVRTTKDLLGDYKNIGGKNISLKIIDPSVSPELLQEAQTKGVQQVQFNVVGQEEFQMKTGFLGLVIAYGGKSEVIPVIQDTSNLEYQVTSLIKKLTAKDKKSVVFLAGHSEKNPQTDYPEFYAELSKQFNVSTYTFEKENPQIADTASVLVIAGPTDAISDGEVQAIKSFLDKDKSVFLLVSNYNLDLQQLSSTEVTSSFAPLLSEYGVTVNKDMVYDLRSNETIRFGNGNFNYFLPYPLWLRSMPKDSNPITNKIRNVVLPWTSSISLSEADQKSKNIEVAKLLISSPYASAKIGAVSLIPDQEFPQTNLGEKLLAVSVNSKDKKGKLVVLGNSDFISSQHIANVPDNLSFGMNAVEWLSSQDSLSDIRVKSNSSGRLAFSDDKGPSFVKTINFVAISAIPLVIGLAMFLRRRSFRGKVYEN